MAKKKSKINVQSINKKDIKPGMTIRVHQTITEMTPKGEEKKRNQVFEGIVIAKKHNNEPGATITVRKISEGIGVEKIFPLNLPTLTKFEMVKQSLVGKAKLYYLKEYKKRLKDISEKKMTSPKGTKPGPQKRKTVLKDKIEKTATKTAAKPIAKSTTKKTTAKKETKAAAKQ